MNEDIIIRYQWTSEEFLTSYRWNFRHRVRPVFRWAFWFLSAAFIVVGILKLRDAQSVVLGVFCLAVGIHVPVMLLLIRPWLVRRQFAKRPDRNGEV